MRQVVCHECRKRYDFDDYDFCPKCGAFTPPKKEWDVDVRGNIVRVDGINERNHEGSFVHQEVHKEKAARKAKGLDRPHPKAKKTRPTVSFASGKKSASTLVDSFGERLGKFLDAIE